MAALHISISAEPIFSLFGLEITNSMFTSLIVSGILFMIALAAKSRLDSTIKKPTGLQNFLEVIVEAFYNLTQSITNSKKKTELILPLILSAFLWILLNNWLGLFPGVGTIGVLVSENDHASFPIITTANAVAPQEVLPPLEGETVDPESLPSFVPIFRPGTADLNTTIALALITMVYVQYMGLKFQGKQYLGKFFNTKGIYSFVGILEFISEISKVISFAFRLFGNIFAGEVLLVVIAFLIPLIAPIPFIGLEIFVGLIQALVFALLSLVFINMATEGHEEHA